MPFSADSKPLHHRKIPSTPSTWPWRGLKPVAHCAQLARRYDAPRLYPPYNEAARLQAEFSPQELALLAADPSRRI